MFDYAVKELLPIVGGRLVRGSGEVRIACAAIDSRNAGPGAAFFAFRGQHRDGHDFVAQAASAGAAAAVVSHALGDEVLEALPEGFALIHVDDSLQALTALAAEHRRRSNARVVAITGSAGKTTTKDMTAAVLGAGFRVVATEGNMNNEIGMPLTLLRLEPQHQAIVLEMAMRARGEIAQLAAVAKPEIGVVINVGTAHLGELGSQENIAAAKAELVQALPPEGVAVLNGDDPRVRAMEALAGCRTVLFGTSDSCHVRAVDIAASADSTTFSLVLDGSRVEGLRFRVTLPGAHNVSNALAALAVGHSLGMGPSVMAEGLGRFVPSAMRMNFIELEDGTTVVDDSYNANPVSTRCAVDAVLQYAMGRRVIAILGDMLELGDEAPEYHRQVGAYAAQRGVEGLVAMGEMARHMARGAVAAGMPQGAVATCDDPAAAAELAKAMARAGDVYLVKGSRGMRMERVAEALARCGR